MNARSQLGDVDFADDSPSFTHPGTGARKDHHYLMFGNLKTLNGKIKLGFLSL
jgi:hypothetical protein